MWSLYTVHNCNKQNSVIKTKHCCHLSVNSRDFIKIVAIWIVNRTETCMRAHAARSLTTTSLHRILKLNPSRHRNILSQLLSEPTNTSCCFVSFVQLKQINRTAIPARRPSCGQPPDRGLPVIGPLTALPMTRSRVRIAHCIVSFLQFAAPYSQCVCTGQQA